MAISIWIQRRRSLVFLFILLAAIFPILLQIAWPFLTSLIVASILAIIIHPIKERLSRRIHPPGLATFLTTCGTVLILGFVLAVAGFTLTKEIGAVYDAFSRSSLEEGGWPAFAATTTNRLVTALASRLPIDKQAIQTELLNGMKNISGYLVSKIGIAVGEITGFLFTGLLVTVFLYFLLKYGKDWIARLSTLTPLDASTSASIINTIHNSVVANVNGMLAVAIGQGILLMLGFWFTGVHSPVLWGTLGGLASVVPVIGSLLVWAPVAIGFLIMGAYWKALILGLWGFLVVGSADNVLRSIVVGKKENQHPMLVALAAIGGTYAFGVPGILLGPMMISLAAALLKEIQRLAVSSKKNEPEEAMASEIQPESGDGE